MDAQLRLYFDRDGGLCRQYPRDLRYFRPRQRPTEVSRWHMPGQHLARAVKSRLGQGYGTRLHHAMRCGDELWAAVWHAGIPGAGCNATLPDADGQGQLSLFPPAIPEPTHTVMPLAQPINGRRYAVAIDEEHDHQPGSFARVLVGDGCYRPLNDMVPVVGLGSFRARQSPWVGQIRAYVSARISFREKLDSTSGLCNLVCRWPAGA